MRSAALAIPLLTLMLSAAPGRAQDAWGVAKKAVGGATTAKVEQEVNRRLLEESRNNQCSFVSDSDRLEPGCDAKVRRLANALVDAKKKLNAAGVKNFKFVVTGHTDTTGSAAHNKELSAKRAAVMERELVGKGIPQADVTSIGMGSEQPLVKPDDTPAKRAKNRRYEIQVRL
jgi:outer membrane protein OmpA-like peptidoglycan-associated protein